MLKRHIVMIESYEGTDTFLRCGNETQEHLFCVIAVDDDGAEIVDNGYRTYDEALQAWPMIGTEGPTETADKA